MLDNLRVGLEEYRYRGEILGYPASLAELNLIVSLYDLYDQTMGYPSDTLRAEALPAALREALHHAYSFTGSEKKLSEIRVTLQRGIGDCPICGISSPMELDHYLPRSQFKALAIYVRNLVPHCHDCNHLKNAKVGASPGEQFIHAYLDVLPDVRFLNADITLGQGGLDVEYSIGSPPELSALLRQRLIYQFDQLRLNERYRRELNTITTGLTSGIALAFEAGGAMGVRRYLMMQANVEARVYHINHWRPVLIFALADHVEFCSGRFQEVLPLNFIS